MKAVIEGRDPVIDEPLDHEAGTVRAPKMTITHGEGGPHHIVGTLTEPDPPPDPDPSDFPAGWCDEMYGTVERLSSEFSANFQAASFVQLSRLVHGWNASVADLPPRMGEQTALLKSLLAEQVKTREAIEAQTKIVQSMVNGLRALYKLIDEGGSQ